VAAPAAAAGSFVRDLRHGWREVRSRAWVWATVLAFSLSLLLAFAPYSVLGPVVARERYGSTSIYGVVAAAFGAGTMLGSLVGVRWRPVRPMLIGCLYTMLWPASLGLFALGVPLALVLPASVAAGAGLGLFMVWWETALAERIPPAALSRVSSYDWMGSLALMPLGYVLAGPAADAFGAVNVLVAGSALALLAQLLALAPRETRALRRLEPGEAPAYVGVT